MTEAGFPRPAYPPPHPAAYPPMFSHMMGKIWGLNTLLGNPAATASVLEDDKKGWSMVTLVVSHYD